MVIKKFNYYLKNGMTLEEIKENILKKVNGMSDSATTGCIAHVFDTVSLKHWIVSSDNIVKLYKLGENVLLFSDFKKVNDLLNTKADKSATYTKTEVDAKVNLKANQATTYTKTEVDTRVNAKANANAVVALTGNQTIGGIKTFSSPIVVPNATANPHAVNLAQLNTKANQATTYTKTEVDTRVNAKANANATVNLTGNQTIAGVKTFSAVPLCSILPTADTQLANRNYVKKRGGYVGVTGGAIDLNRGINFSLNLTAATNITIANAAANIGQTGEIFVGNGANIRGFNAPFNFRIAQSGFGGNEVFSYLVVDASLVRITRS